MKKMAPFIPRDEFHEGDEGAAERVRDRTMHMDALAAKLRSILPAYHAGAVAAAQAVQSLLQALASRPLDVAAELMAFAKLPRYPQAAALLQVGLLTAQESYQFLIRASVLYTANLLCMR